MCDPYDVNPARQVVDRERRHAGIASVDDDARACGCGSHEESAVFSGGPLARRGRLWRRRGWLRSRRRDGGRRAAGTGQGVARRRNGGRRRNLRRRGGSRPSRRIGRSGRLVRRRTVFGERRPRSILPMLAAAGSVSEREADEQPHGQRKGERPDCGTAFLQRGARECSSRLRGLRSGWRLRSPGRRISSVEFIGHIIRDRPGPGAGASSRRIGHRDRLSLRVALGGCRPQVQIGERGFVRRRVRVRVDAVIALVKDLRARR